jgi:frataxin-like iron-binding protein CyaY
MKIKLKSNKLINGIIGRFSSYKNILQQDKGLSLKRKKNNEIPEKDEDFNDILNQLNSKNEGEFAEGLPVGKTITQTKEDFLKISKKFLIFLHKKFTDFSKENKNLEIQLELETDSLVVILPKLGSYFFNIDKELQMLDMISPVSGLFKYHFNPERMQWVSEKDAHFLEDLLIREFCQHSTGMLDINTYSSIDKFI